MSQLEFNIKEHTERITWFADVVLPLPIPKTYTYRVPYKMNSAISEGCRVIVQFGRRKIHTGVVKNLHQQAPEKYEAKLILELLDELPIIGKEQFQLYEWMSSYYMCSLGEVLNAAMPSGLKLSSESRLQLHPEYLSADVNQSVNPEEQLIMDILEREKSISYSEIHKFLDIKGLYKHIKSLLDKQMILLYEQVSEKYKPKKEKRISLKGKYAKEENLSELLDQLATKPGQENIIMGYLKELADIDQPIDYSLGLPLKTFKTEEYSTSSLNTLIKNGIFDKFEVIVPRIKIEENRSNVELADFQAIASSKIMKVFEKQKPVLLHGITGSGKTEIYIHLINQVLENDQQVLYLLPEIALTTQIIQRLLKAFGSSFGVYHSRYSDNERVEVWQGIMNGSIKFVVGVRSSVMLPFHNLGLVIIDEEHESSYKQFQPTPKYHARDVGLMLGKIFHSKVILGSATPSMESYFNALNGKYELIELTERFGEAHLPKYKVIDIKRERDRKKVRGEFSVELLEKIKEGLDKGEQSIIFQNRRGYSPAMECSDCGWISQCIQCSVSLTYHQYRNELKCHYCGYSETPPHTCPDCGSHKIQTIGFGTQKLEEDLMLLFPDARIERMDLDSTRSKFSYEKIINGFAGGDIDILVGTQMLSKGLDFDKISTVGIVDLDRMLHFPDFRSFERTFQLATQVAGRAGRRNLQGNVIIQTRKPDHLVVRQIFHNDFSGFYQQELKDRNAYSYPPFTRLIKVIFKHRDKETANQAAIQYGVFLRSIIKKEDVLGPEEPMISKIRNHFLYDIIIKLPKELKGINQLKAHMIHQSILLQAKKEFSGIRVDFDVDPV